MSDGWLRKRAKSFETHSAKARNEYVRPTLFTMGRPETTSVEYACELADGGCVAPGMSVTLLRSNCDVQVIDCNRRVGWVSAEDKASISPILDAYNGIVTATVVGITLIGDVFHVQV